LAVRDIAPRRRPKAPFGIIGLDWGGRIAAAIIQSILYKTLTVIELTAQRVFSQNTLVGLIISAASLFVLEQVRQKSPCRVCSLRRLGHEPPNARIS
jgi:hypothetical protein